MEGLAIIQPKGTTWKGLESAPARKFGIGNSTRNAEVNQGLKTDSGSLQEHHSVSIVIRGCWKSLGRRVYELSAEFRYYAARGRQAQPSVFVQHSDLNIGVPSISENVFRANREMPFRARLRDAAQGKVKRCRSGPIWRCRTGQS